MICYRCTVLPPQHLGDADQPCSKFDESSKFYQDCPTSTFCMKKIIRSKLRNESKYKKIKISILRPNFIKNIDLKNHTDSCKNYRL